MPPAQVVADIRRLPPPALEYTMRPAHYQSPVPSANPAPHSQTASIERLAGAGLRAEAILALLHSGQADLIQGVIDGRLDIERALKICKQRGRP